MAVRDVDRGEVLFRFQNLSRETVRLAEAELRVDQDHVLFAGNALATHDMEAALYGTSLGMSLQSGAATRGGHEHHLRTINLIRRLGSIRTAVM